ncbi:MAG: histidine phosphatase family protein [Anaerolineae bacterium]
METQLFLIRHGHTLWNGVRRYQGHAPVPLSDRGKAQADCLARAVAGSGTPDALISSDLLRCRQTVEPIGRALGIDPIYDRRLREIDYGNWQGLTREEAEAWDAEAYAAYIADPFTGTVPGGESQSALAARVTAALDEALASYAGGQIMLVTHGGPVRAILRRFDLWPGGLPVSNASVTELVVEDTGRASLVRFSDVAHLPPDLRSEASGTAFVA